LTAVKMPKTEQAVKSSKKFIGDSSDSEDEVDANGPTAYALSTLACHKKMFSTCWLKFLNFNLPSELLKRVLLKIDTVLPHFSEPFLVVDFLKDCYNKGELYSILALNGMFVLMTKFNFDFPEFYKELYALFKPALFHTKYRGKFFILAGLFLSSGYLPGYVVAAFIKRVARLALSAPAPGAILAVVLIHNIMLQHQACQVLLHNASGKEQAPTPILLVGSAAREAGIGASLGTDPYIFEEQDPARCGALQSSLWEIRALENHTHPDVSKFAKSLTGKLQSLYIMKDYATTTYQSLFMSEFEKKQTNFPVDLDDTKQAALFTTHNCFTGWKW